jgi:hypothetical protein
VTRSTFTSGCKQRKRSPSDPPADKWTIAAIFPPLPADSNANKERAINESELLTLSIIALSTRVRARATPTLKKTCGRLHQVNTSIHNEIISLFAARGLLSAVKD